MKRTIFVIAALVALGIGASVLFAGDAPAQTADVPDAAPETARSVAQGELVGFVAPSGAHVWRHVPFAADTGGANRWRAPRPAPSWEGVREGLAQGPRCPQIANDFTMSDAPFEAGDLLGDEACLNFDIYAPADAQGKNLPVMMWIHGGSNVSGTAADYDGSFLAVNENVIVMVVQYRLGPLGWFSHPALREAAETADDRAANFGTLDLIAALEWIKENAGAFGGDAGNVTIFGESAGGHNVATLLAAPAAEGLFHRAIIQSGGFDSVSVDEAEGRTGELANASLDVATRLGGPELFHTASTQQVFDAFELDASGYMDLPRVIEDGVVLPDTPLRSAFSDTQTFHTVPIITGINRDEMKMFQVLNPRFTRARLGRLVVARDAGFYAASAEYGSRVWRIRAVDMPAAQMAKAGHGDVYAYRFDWDDGGRVLITNLKKLLGAAHGMEIPFVFNKFELLGPMDRFMFQKKTFEARDELSRDMGAYWASFARDGVPSHAGEPEWPTYVRGGEALLRLDSDSDGGIGLLQGADSFEAILADIQADKRVDAEERCQLLAGLSEWLPDAGADMGCGV